MLKVTSDTIPGREIEETLGVVVANAVRARHVGRDILAGLKNIVGGEIGAYQHLLKESREEAITRVEADAAATECSTTSAPRPPVSSRTYATGSSTAGSTTWVAANSSANSRRFG